MICGHQNPFPSVTVPSLAHAFLSLIGGLNLRKSYLAVKVDAQRGDQLINHFDLLGMTHHEKEKKRKERIEAIRNKNNGNGCGSLEWGNEERVKGKEKKERKRLN